ncbi:MAG TPA: hypothetical protein VI524_08715 [Anaerolineales bacterium]|nr:hypothetical protein [Anaerolineales bacterium]
MTESNEKQAGFLGTYFDRDAVLRLARWADVLAWVILTVYVLSWLISFLMFLAQYLSGLYIDKGATFLTVLSIFAPYFQQPLPGVFYFFGLQAVSKGILILLDMEDNTRRAARK